MLFQLFDRKMAVRLDKQPGMTPEEQAQLPSRLPEGLASVGMGLGSNGNPLTEVAKNIANQVTDLEKNILCFSVIKKTGYVHTLGE